MIFLSIILIIGILTSFTDLKNKKIYNQHLAIGAILGFIAITYAAFFKHEYVFFHIINGLIAFLIGLILHHSAIWRGGDAKLFTLYAFLMPSLKHNPDLFSEPTNLFVCSFIIGMFILAPILIKDMILNYNTIIRNLILPSTCMGIFTGIGTMALFSWIFFPIFSLARITNPVIVLTISYLIFNWGYSPQSKINLKKILTESILGYTFGFLMRILLFPDSLSYTALSRYIIMITLSTAISICIHTTFNHFRNYQERIPFAPLLFIGCILSYTPFLTWITHFLPR